MNLSHYPLREDDTRILSCRRCQVKNRIALSRAFQQPDKLRCGSCQGALLPTREAAMTGLPSAAYQHPLDRQTLAAVEAIPGVTTILKKLVEVTYERYFRLFNQSSFVQVGHGQLPTLQRLFEKAAFALGLSELPDLYIYQAPVVNAYTYGVEHPFVALSSTLCDLFEEDEIFAVMAHELSHWHSQHVLYKTAARLLVDAAGGLARATLGLGNLVIMPIQMALLKWDRCSELTADRGMLLCTRDPTLSLRVLLKLAGATGRLRGELSLDRFMEQALRARQAPEEGVLDRLYTVLQSLWATHPFPLWRAAELWSWACEGEYLNLLQAHS